MTNARWSYDQQLVLTTGGADHALFQWRFLSDDVMNGDLDINLEGGIENHEQLKLRKKG